MSNESALERRIKSSLAAGRKLSCYGPVDASMSKAEFIAEIARRTGYNFIHNVFKAESTLCAPGRDG